MEHFYKKLGESWFTYPNLYSDMVKRFDGGSHFVEVGSWKGMSAAYMAVEIINSKKDIKIDCIDIWEYSDIQKDIAEHKFKNLYNTFLNNITPVKNIITPIKGISWEVASLYVDNSLDFIFIDAAHDYESVKKDIIAWYPKLKNNGVLAGHDYTTSSGVHKAVHEIFKEVHSTEGCWIINPK